MASSPREDNRVPALVAKSDADNTPVIVEADPATKRLKVNATITGGITNAEPIDITGTFTNATQTTNIPTVNSLDGYEAATVSINGTYGTATAIFEGSDDDGVTWYTLQAARTDSSVAEVGYTSLTNLTRMWTIQITGLDTFRVRSTAVASGTVNVRISISSAPTADAAVVSIGGVLPDNTTTGSIVANGGTVITTVVPGMAGWTLGYYGTYATGASLTMEASHDGGSTYYAVRMLQVSTSTLGYVVTIAAVSNSSTAFTADIPSGATHLRVRCSAWAAPTGAINIVLAQSVERFATGAIGGQSITSSTLTPGAAAANLGKAEDAVAASGDVGVGALVVQTASPADAAGDGDYAFPQMKNGRVWTSTTIDTAPPTSADKTGSGTISSLNGAVTATTNGCSIVSFNIAGSWSATLNIEATIDAGSTWIAIDGDVDATDSLISSTTANGLVTVNCGSYGQVRLRANPYTSGTANITWSANVGLSLVEVFNTNATSLKTTGSAEQATGSAVPTNAQYQGVSDGTNIRGTLGAANALNSTGTGVPTAQIIGQFDDVSPTIITENQFGNLRMSATRELYTVDRPINGTALTTYSVHLTTNTTTTPTSSTAYVSSIAISSEVAGTTSTITIQDKQGTPLKLINGFSTTTLTTTPTVVNFQTPVKMVSGVDIITAGAVAATVDIFLNYYQ